MENFNNLTPQMKKIWRTSTNRMKSLKSPSSKKNKQKLAISQRRNLQMTIWKNNSFFLKSKRKKNHKTIKEEWINGWNRRKKNHIDLSTISLLQNSSHLTHPADAGKVKIIWKEGQKHKKNQTKYISKIHQDGRSIEEFKKDEKRKRKLHNLCQPISNWKLIKWRQKPGKIGYFKLTTGNNL
jgi:hypothetical protein